jgi:translation initiation factor 2 subunit 3
LQEISSDIILNPEISEISEINDKKEYFDEMKPEINIGIVGMVSHGKTTLIQALTGVDTRKYKKEQKTNKTIKLGYTTISITECFCTSTVPIYLTSHCGNPECNCVKASIVDCPGHKVLLKTMISGACIMDVCVLVSAANEPCPQQQTSEHMQIIKMLKTSSEFMCVQNKIDLCENQFDIVQNKQQIETFIGELGLTEEECPIIPVSAQNNINIDFVLKCMYDKIKNIQKKKQEVLRLTEEEEEETEMLGTIVRTFDINLPTEVNEKNKLFGVVIGGSIIKGSVKIGDTITILPSNIQTKVIDIKCEQYNIYSAKEGGLIAIQTDLSPEVCDSLVGSIFTKTITSSLVRYNEGDLINFTLKKMNDSGKIHNGDIITCQCLTLSFKVKVINKDKKNFTCILMSTIYIPKNYCIIVLNDDKIYGYSLESIINKPVINLISWSKHPYLYMLENAKDIYTSSNIKLIAPIIEFMNKVTKIVNFTEICDSLKCSNSSKQLEFAKYMEEELSLKSWSINVDNQLLIKGGGKIEVSAIQKVMVKFAKKKRCNRCKNIITEIIKINGVNKILCQECLWTETVR